MVVAVASKGSIKNLAVALSAVRNTVVKIVVVVVGRQVVMVVCRITQRVDGRAVVW